MPNGKSPGNDGLTKEVFETFWSEVKKKKIFIMYFTLFRERGTLCKINKKKDKDKRLIQN